MRTKNVKTIEDDSCNLRIEIVDEDKATLFYKDVTVNILKVEYLEDLLRTIKQAITIMKENKDGKI